MSSYFVALHAPHAAEVTVHDRSCCPPACFLPEGGTEYLGEFNDAGQAVAVARLRYAHARACTVGEPARVPAPQPGAPQPTTAA
jgi:hypothetical protein